MKVLVAAYCSRSQWWDFANLKLSSKEAQSKQPNPFGVRVASSLSGVESEILRQ